ncbi:Protein Iojap-related [Hirschfeldia incana]|nr:Protein Iojap-related [Hirschfeldia incana]
MLAALRSRCSSSLPSLLKSPPSLPDQSWKKLGLSASNHIFASPPSFSSSSSGTARDISEVLSVPEVEKILSDVKADNVIVIPTHNQSCWADVTIIATGRSDWHLKNIAQALVYRAKQKQRGEKHVMLPCVQGYDTKWIVIDYGKFVVHALDEKARVYFNLEALWTGEPASSANDNSDKDLQNAFVKVRPINNSKKKKPAQVSS